MPTRFGYFILVSFGVLCASGVIEGQQCPQHPVPATAFSVCSDGRRHKSMCETKCKSGFRLKGPSRMMCWCKGGKCLWNGVKASCERMKCDFPDVENGSLRFADVWHGGFAGLVEMDNVVASAESNFGWSIVIIFDTPLGKKASLKSWNLELTATSYDGQTFTLVNSETRPKLSKSLDDKGRFSTLIVVENVEGEIPQSAFTGLYYKRVKDATCLVAPKMPEIRQLYSEKAAPLVSTTIELETTTPFSTTTSTTKRTMIKQRRFKKPRPNRQKIRTTTESSRPQTTKETLTTTSTSTAARTTAPTTISTSKATQSSATTLSADDNFCVEQNHEEYFVAEEGWEDRGLHQCSGNVALESLEQLPDWRMVVVFKDEIKAIETWACRVLHSSEDGLIWTFGPHLWNTKLSPGRTDIRFIATQAYATVGLPTAQVFLCSGTFTEGDAVIGGTGLGLAGPTNSPLKTTEMGDTAAEKTTTPTSSTLQCNAVDPAGRPVVRAGQTNPIFKPNNDGTKYNYNEVIHKSILFYEAQRSGRLPENNRIPWRGDSALKDGCGIGVDVTGGWYDAGDYVKFNFPMAYSLTTLAWGGILFRDAYEDAGELQSMIDSIKWPVKYFIKAHISKYELVAQVGHGQTDHNYWGRPEQMRMNRPAYKITDKKPGTELAAEVAAALAASSIFLNSTDPDLADKALAHSKQLFEFADKYRGNYHVSIPDAALYYKSYSGYDDELVWAAAWLYKATNDSKYLTAAERFYVRMRGKYKIAAEFSWDDKLAGAQALLAEMTGSEDYRRPFLQFLNNLPNRKSTPQGLFYLGDWGTNRYAANAAFMLIIGSRLTPNPTKKTQYIKLAKKQIGLLLGDTGRSFVVGFGVNPPKRAHHASSGCPEYPERCDWTIYHSSHPNHYILYGALVGGPNLKGVFSDSRSIYQETEVACDYNAGFQSAVAGLKHFAMLKRYRAATTAPQHTTTTEQQTTAAVTSSPKKRPVTKRPCRPKRSRKCIKARLAKKSTAKL